VLILSKDRFKKALKAVKQARAKIPYEKLVLVESSVCLPSKYVNELNGFDVELIRTPNALLGDARQTGFEATSSKYVAILDDDIIIDADWYKQMRQSLEDAPGDVIAVSPFLLFGYGESDTVMKVCEARRGTGWSGGCCLMKRDKIMEVGGFSRVTHIGEDSELYARIRGHGYDWIRDNRITAYHPCTFMEWLSRPWKNPTGFIYLCRADEIHPLRLLARRGFAATVMPLYYLYLTGDPRVAGAYSLYKAIDFVAGLKMCFMEYILRWEI